MNPWTQFNALLPKSKIVIGNVQSRVGDTYYVLCPGAQGLIAARSASDITLGTQVFVRDGVIQAATPALPSAEIDV